MPGTVQRTLTVLFSLSAQLAPVSYQQESPRDHVTSPGRHSPSPGSPTLKPGPCILTTEMASSMSSWNVKPTALSWEHCLTLQQISGSESEESGKMGAVCTGGASHDHSQPNSPGAPPGSWAGAGLLPLVPLPHLDAYPAVSGCHHKALEASRPSEPFYKRKETHEKHQFVLQLDAVRPPKLEHQPSPWECSWVGNRKLIKFSWGLCQPSPSPEYKALHRYSISFTPLTDQSREGKGVWPRHQAGSPQGYGMEPRDSEHDTSGICSVCLLNELMSPPLHWETWPRREKKSSP